jgi:hypothetical protein
MAPDIFTLTWIKGTGRVGDTIAKKSLEARRTRSMITLEDRIGLCGLTEEEVLAVAEHEHLPQVAATAFAQYLLSRDHAVRSFGT